MISLADYDRPITVIFVTIILAVCYRDNAFFPKGLFSTGASCTQLT